MGHGIYGFHQTFIPAFNSTTARLERPDWKGRQIKSQQSGNSQPISGNKTGSTFCWSSTIWLVANRFGPTTVRTKRANSERRLDQPENFWGPLFMGPCWLSFQCPECSLYSIAPLAFTSGGTIELIGMGLGAMGSTDFTKLLFLLSIAQRLEWRGQTQFCWSSTIWLVANRFGPTTVRTKGLFSSVFAKKF